MNAMCRTLSEALLIVITAVLVLFALPLGCVLMLIFTAIDLATRVLGERGASIHQNQGGNR